MATKTKPKAKKPPGQKKKEGKLTEPKRKLNISEEERKRRSEAMKKRHEEGKVGGSEFGKMGGRPKKKRAAEVVAEEASENGEKIAQVFLDAMDEENPHSIRMKAAEAMVKIEKDEARLALDEQEALRKMDRADLIRHVAEQFSGNPMVMEMFRQAASSAPSDRPAIQEGTSEEEAVADAEVVN